MALSRFIGPFFDAGDGIKPSVGAKLFFLETGTSTPKDTFNCPDGTTANSNPVIANADGLFPDIFLQLTSYKVILKDRNDVQIWEADPVDSTLLISNAEFVKNSDTVAAMIADTGLVAGDTVNTVDYYSTQRGGGAEYLVKTTAQASTDGDIIDGFGNHTLDTGDVAILQSDHTALNFGAGIAVATAALQALLDKEGTITIEPVSYNSGPLTVTGESYIDATGATFNFTHTTGDTITVDAASGFIKGLIVNDVAAVSGIFGTLFLKSCNKFNLEDCIVNDGKALPVVFFESDDCHAVRCHSIATDSTRPFGWELIGCQGSTFSKCSIFKTQFGFLTIGQGLKSEEPRFRTTRPSTDTFGMQILNCTVLDHENTAFDINGAFGALIDGCTGKDYTGTGGGSPTFQVKQSTNIPEEEDDETFQNIVTNCISINGGTGFSTQQGQDVLFKNNIANSPQRYGLSVNDTDRVKIDGLTVNNWGNDLITSPLEGGDVAAAAIVIRNNAARCSIDNINLNLDAGHDVSQLEVIHNQGNTNSVGKLTIRNASGGTLVSGLRNTGSNLSVSEEFRIGSGGYTDFVVDTTISTIYPVKLSIRKDDAQISFRPFDNMITRGFIPVKVKAYWFGAGVSPDFSVGKIGDVDFYSPLVTMTERILSATDATGEILSPSQTLFLDIRVAGVSSTLVVQVEGITLL